MTTTPTTLAGIRAAIAQLLTDAMPKVTVNAYQAGAVYPPTIELMIGTTTFHETHGELDDEGYATTIRVRVYASMVDNAGASAELEKYLEPAGPFSIKHALEAADPDDLELELEVLGHNGEQMYGNADEGGVLVGSEFTVAVIV